MRVHAILNPHGGKQVGARLLEEARGVLEEAGVEVLVHPTKYAGHAVEIAASLELLEGDVLSPIGGDGTTYEVVNGMLSRPDGKRAPVGLIPAGSSNYLGQTMGLPPEDGAAAARAILGGQLKNLDVAKIQSSGEDVFALCAMSWGYFVDLVECAERNRWIGVRRYDLAGLHELWKTKPRAARLVVDGEPVEGRFSMILAYNTEYSGRQKKLDPEAKVDDGLWDLLYCEELGKLHLAEFLASVGRGDGSWKNSSHVTFRRFRSLTLESESPVNVDGEPNLDPPLKFDVIPSAIQLFTA
jgi:diacylglycerol kinase (ATP)